MKNTLYLLFTLLLIAVIAIASLSCSETTQVNCKEGSAEIILKSQQADNFHSVDLTGSGHILLSQGVQYHVLLETDDNLINNVVFSVISNTLSIGTNKDICPTKLNVSITAPDFKSLAISGSGNITNETALQLQDLELLISGSGNINLDSLGVENLKTTISGSGNIEPDGSGNSANILISGSGNFTGFNLPVKIATATIDGSGNIEVNASDTLTVTIAGSGNVLYRGNPVLNTSITGSGKVIHQP